MKDTTEDNQDFAEQQDLQLCPLVGPSRCPVTDILVKGSSWGHQVTNGCRACLLFHLGLGAALKVGLFFSSLGRLPIGRTHHTVHSSSADPECLVASLGGLGKPLLLPVRQS